jgi:hypothetical protein
MADGKTAPASTTEANTAEVVRYRCQEVRLSGEDDREGVQSPGDEPEVIEVLVFQLKSPGSSALPCFGPN